jgi:amino acid permease
VLYGACTEPVAGNILNSFADDDQLVNVGKLGLAITIMLHLPMLVVPCRDTLGRIHRCLFPLQTDVNQNTDISIASREQVIPVDDADDPLAEDQLTEAFVQISAFDTESDSASTCTVKQLSGDVWLTLTVMGLDIFLAFLITDVALVWDLLGSTVSIIIAYILPCSAYIIIRRIKPITNLEMMLAWFVLVGSIVIGFVCTGNVIYKLSSQGS